VGGEGEGVFEELSGLPIDLSETLSLTSHLHNGMHISDKNYNFSRCCAAQSSCIQSQMHEDLKRKEGATKETILTVCRGDHLAFTLSRRPSFFPLAISC
jgi:hypothetical protein